MILNEPIRALSWKQPYAELMLHGKIETRTWKTDYRGLVLMCASQKGYNEYGVFSISGGIYSNQIIKTLNYTDLYAVTHFLKNGNAFATGRLVDCRPMTEKDEAKCSVHYTPGKFCHIYKEVRPIKPFEWKGTQKWGTVSQDVIDKIEYL